MCWSSSSFGFAFLACRRFYIIRRRRQPPFIRDLIPSPSTLKNSPTTNMMTQANIEYWWCTITKLDLFYPVNCEASRKRICYASILWMQPMIYTTRLGLDSAAATIQFKYKMSRYLSLRGWINSCTRKCRSVLQCRCIGRYTSQRRRHPNFAGDEDHSFCTKSVFYGALELLLSFPRSNVSSVICVLIFISSDCFDTHVFRYATTYLQSWTMGDESQSMSARIRR